MGQLEKGIDHDWRERLSEDVEPAHRALARAGYTRLDQLAKVSEAEILGLHGVGPKSIRELRAALADAGLSLDPSA